MLDLGPGGKSSGSLDLLPDRLPDPPLHAKLVSMLLGMRAREVDATRMASLGRRESNLGGNSLDALSFPVLGVDSSTNKLRTSNVADIVFRDLLIVSVLDILGYVEGDGDSAFLDFVRVSDDGIASGEGAVQGDVGPQVGEREFERIASILKRNASNGMRLHQAVHPVPVCEESGDTEQEKASDEEPDEPLGNAPLLLLLTICTVAEAQALPETDALWGGAEGEVDALLVQTVDRKFRLNGLLDISGIFRHEGSVNGRHG